MIIHIVDTDGVYIPEIDIKEADVEKAQYYEDHIDVKNVKAIVNRNRRKGAILYKLRKTGKINGIPYRIYFNSCNLEHVLYDELKDFTDEEKQILSDDFADKYDGKVNEFIEFISDNQIAVPGTFQKTWDYIEKDRNSLNRHSNMHLILNRFYNSKDGFPLTVNLIYTVYLSLRRDKRRQKYDHKRSGRADGPGPLQCSVLRKRKIDPALKK